MQADEQEGDLIPRGAVDAVAGPVQWLECDGCGIGHSAILTYPLRYNGRGVGCVDCMADGKVARDVEASGNKVVSAALFSLALLSWALVVVAVVVGVA